MADDGRFANAPKPITMWIASLAWLTMWTRRYGVSEPTLRGRSPEDVRLFVDGGFLRRLVTPQPGPDGRMLDPPLVNVLDAYLHLMEDNLRRAQEIHANS